MATVEDYFDQKSKFLIKIYERNVDPNEKNPKQLTFKLEPFYAKENVLAVKTIRVDGRALRFEGTEEMVRVDLWVLRGSKTPLIYSDVNVMKGYDFNDQISKFLIVRPVRNAKAMNKRGAYRVKVGLPCRVNEHAQGDHFNAFVKDVSASGFAIELKTSNVETLYKNRDTFSVEFEDSTISSNKIAMEGTIVRKSKTQNETVYGLVVDNPSKQYMNYVMKKQSQKAHS